MVKRCCAALLLLLAAALQARAQDLLLEAELAPAEVYVQAQAVYRLRFLHAVDVRDVQLDAPGVRLADLRPIGDARVYEARRGDKRYRVHERSYAVFPFSSGKLELDGAHASGHSASGQPLRLEAPRRVLTVLPADIGADGAPWLPAASLTLSEEWKTQDNGVHRRTIRIEASGVEAAALPEPAVEVDGMNVLAGIPVLQNRFAGEHNVALREQTFVLMPTRGGLARVPELQLRWWHTGTRSAARASLPARTLYLGDPGAADSPRAEIVPVALGHLWAVGAAAVLLLALALLRTRRMRYALRLRQACKAGDLQAVRDGLLALAAHAYADPPRTLGALADRLPDAAAAERVRALERSLYGPAATPWTPAALAAVVGDARRAMRGNKKHP